MTDRVIAMRWERERVRERERERSAYFERDDTLLDRVETLGDLPESVETLEQLRRRPAQRRRLSALHRASDTRFDEKPDSSRDRSSAKYPSSMGRKVL